jgi:4-hydroxy-tetrahydrodipicolinate reductase
MKIGIIGYGRMGKLIAEIAKEKGHEINAIIDPNLEEASKEINDVTLKDVDVCIDFSSPETIFENIEKVSSLGKNIVVGTTGWYDSMDQVKETISKNSTGLIWSGNFSLGVNVFFKIVEETSKIFNNLPEYDVLGLEYHHKNKKDSPSGTARMIADRIISNIGRKEKIVYDKLDRKIEDNELHIASVRGGSIPGIHEVKFDSDEDTIILRHEARNRVGFAVGAVKAAEFIEGKKGFYSIDDLMKEIFGGNKNE